MGEKFVDPKIIQASIDWLLANQDKNTGRFPIVGRVIHTDMKGGVQDTDTLTCYVAQTLIKADKLGLYPDSGRANMNTILSNLEEIIQTYLDGDITDKDMYAFSLCAHTYMMAHEKLRTKVYNKLQLIAKTSPDMKWWDNKPKDDDSFKPDDECWNCRRHDKQTVAVEMTSY